MKSLQQRQKHSRFLIVLCILLSLVACLGDDDDDQTNGDGSFEGEMVWLECDSTATDTTIYYVSPTGDDDATGTSESTTFRTLLHALRKVRPGGSILILPGTYSESIVLQDCGKSGTPITISGHNGIPVLDGQNSLPIALFLEECAGFVFSDILIQNYTDIGLGISMSESMTIKDTFISENGQAVQLTDWELEGYGVHVEDSYDVLIENNDVHRNGPDPQIFPDYLMGTGINTYGNTNVVIRNNLAHDNVGGGILVEDSVDVLVEGNVVYGNDCDASEDNWWDAGLWVDGGHDVLIRNNLFRDNLGPGIEISDEDLQQPYGYVLENNISTSNYYGVFIWNFGTTDWPDESILSRNGNDFSDNSILDVWIEDWL